MNAPPHQGISLQEKLDALLTTAAFDQHVALLFIDEGIFQLKKSQKTEPQALKDTASIFNALEIYDVKDLYVETESLQEWGLTPSDLTLPVTQLPREEVNPLMQQFDVIS